MLGHRRTYEKREEIINISLFWEHPITVEGHKFFFKVHPEKSDRVRVKAMINIRRPGMNRGLYYDFPHEKVALKDVRELIKRHLSELLSYGKK